MIRRVTIEKLAPTGEGVARTLDGVGFVAGALPGEEVEAEVTASKKRFWFGSALSVRPFPSRDRVAGPHAGCPACDWSHLDLGAAREAKVRLFLETMERIGQLEPETFGPPLRVVPSPPSYRIRSRFHVEGRGRQAILGFHAPGTRRVLPAQACEALSDAMRAALPAVQEAVASSGLAVSEIETLETADASRRVAAVTLPRSRRALRPGALVGALTAESSREFASKARTAASSPGTVPRGSRSQSKAGPSRFPPERSSRSTGTCTPRSMRTRARRPRQFPRAPRSTRSAGRGFSPPRCSTRGTASCRSKAAKRRRKTRAATDGRGPRRIPGGFRRLLSTCIWELRKTPSISSWRIRLGRASA